MFKVPGPKSKVQRLELPRIYPITDTAISGLSHLEQVKRLIDGGATLIQVREKSASPHEFYAAAGECVAYARPRGVKIIINDRADIALASNADGVHLGQDDMPPTAARELLGIEAIIGYSTHSVEQAIAAAPTGVDYIAIGPIFGTTTKEKTDPAVGPGGIAAVRSAIGDMPLVAIGGINTSNLTSVFAAGADSAALISCLLRDPEAIIQTLNQLLAV